MLLLFDIVNLQRCWWIFNDLFNFDNENNDWENLTQNICILTNINRNNINYNFQCSIIFEQKIKIMITLL